MRVLHINAGNLYGGVERLLVTLATCRRLCPQMDPEFAVCFEGRLSRELASAGAPVHQLGKLRVRNPLSVRRARQQLRRLLLGRTFDVVICHMSWSQAIFGPVVRSEGVPLVLWAHDVPNRRRWVERWAQRIQPDLIVSNSGFNATSLRSLYPNFRVETIYCPVARSLYDGKAARASVRTEFATDANSIVIAQLSRFEEWKGHQTLLAALSRLCAIPDWTCWIIGGAQRAAEARYVERLKAAGAQLGIADRVRFIGERSDTDRLLAAADLFCQPNTGPEPFGLVFIEALYAGLPVVTTAIGGAKEIVDESCGMLVPPANADALANALEKLLANPALRAKLGGAGPARAAKLCDPARQMGRLDSGLRQILRFDNDARVEVRTVG